ncbi:MAG: threonine synthase [Anaerolineae bacterium]|nr:MAG: threonine synthase [Anaerolineae bacterium]
MSLLTHLECARCRRAFDPHLPQTYCPDCQAPLLPRYDLQKGRAEVDRERLACRPRGMWRWRELMPVFDERHIVSLGEGDTPLLHARHLGERVGAQVYIKDEAVNPTGTFKARGLSAAVSKARELGQRRLIIPTAGNAGGALAAYAARGGMQAAVFMPADTPWPNRYECQIAGAQVTLVDGLISDAGRLVAERVQQEDWFSVSTFKEPYRVEGKKTMGYELAQAFGWRLPDVILYPTGGGTGLVGMWKAFAELEALGWLEDTTRPRMVAVQAAGCAPVVQAFHRGAARCDFWEGAQTMASGLRVPKSFADMEILSALRESEGTAVAVSDEEIAAAQRELAAAEGVFAAPEGAATLAGLKKLLAAGWIRADERVVLFNTGSGLKYIPPPATGEQV